MNAYLASVLENVRTKHGNEPEFVQTVEEVFSSIEPVIEKHPEYEKVDLLDRMVEPERMFTFRVVLDGRQWPVAYQHAASAASSTAPSAPTRAACGSRRTSTRASSSSWALSRPSRTA